MTENEDEPVPSSGIFGWALTAWLLFLAGVTLGLAKCSA